MSTDQWPKLSPFECGVKACCPRCGQGRLFDGFLKLAPKCEVCGLDYSFADPADGPAFFVICFGCIPSVMFGLWLEVAYQAPYWVHLVTTLPVLLAFFLTHLRRRLIWLPTGLLLGGAAGNLIDRVRLGAVTDFVKFPFWPAFNVADIAVTFGVLSLIYVLERTK